VEGAVHFALEFWWVSAIWSKAWNEPPTKQLPSLEQEMVFLRAQAFDPFVSVEHHLHGKGRMAAHLDGEMAPLSVDEVKVVMINVRPAFRALQVRTQQMLLVKLRPIGAAPNATLRSFFSAV
jgi:hypothetical protein